MDIIIDELKKLSAYLQEHRSDIADHIDSILEGDCFDPTYIEGRYVYGDIEGHWVEYDTLTTLLEYQKPEHIGVWYPAKNMRYD